MVGPMVLSRCQLRQKMTSVKQHLGNSAPLFQALLCIFPLCLCSEREGRRAGALSLPLAWAGGTLGLKFGTTLLCAVRRQDSPWAAWKGS